MEGWGFVVSLLTGVSFCNGFFTQFEAGAGSFVSEIIDQVWE
jgi:hypothetical protein